MPSKQKTNRRRVTAIRCHFDALAFGERGAPGRDEDPGDESGFFFAQIRKMDANRSANRYANPQNGDTHRQNAFLQHRESQPWPSKKSMSPSSAWASEPSSYQSTRSIRAPACTPSASERKRS